MRCAPSQSSLLTTFLKLYIKYMLSARCKTVVKEELKKLHLHFVVVDLGEVEIMEELSEAQLDDLGKALMVSGLELMEDKRGALVEKIKSSIILMVQSSSPEQKTRTNLSDFLSEKLNQDYTLLANLFSEMQGTTVEQFFIAQKVERVKELIMYHDFTFTEIAYQMNYSSIAHLSNQFKKETGLTPTHFKLLRKKIKSPKII